MLDPLDLNRLEMGGNKVVSDGVLRIKDWCLPFKLNLFTALSTKAVVQSSRVHSENLSLVIQKILGPTMFD